MILELFLTFLKIGVVSFGGGYGMISVVRDEVIKNAWLTEEEFINFLAVAESTPGPIAINMATFIGSTKAGILGSFVATLGVVLPAFFIILIISVFLKNLLKYGGVQAVLEGVRPAVTALIIGTAVITGISLMFNIKTVKSDVVFELKQTLIFIIIVITATVIKKVFKKKISPIILIIISAGLGILFYAV